MSSETETRREVALSLSRSGVPKVPRSRWRAKRVSQPGTPTPASAPRSPGTEVAEVPGRGGAWPRAPERLAVRGPRRGPCGPARAERGGAATTPVPATVASAAGQVARIGAAASGRPDAHGSAARCSLPARGCPAAARKRRPAEPTWCPPPRRPRAELSAPPRSLARRRPLWTMPTAAALGALVPGLLLLPLLLPQHAGGLGAHSDLAAADDSAWGGEEGAEQQLETYHDPCKAGRCRRGQVRPKFAFEMPTKRLASPPRVSLHPAQTMPLRTLPTPVDLVAAQRRAQGGGSPRPGGVRSECEAARWPCGGTQAGPPGAPAFPGLERDAPAPGSARLQVLRKVSRHGAGTPGKGHARRTLQRGGQKGTRSRGYGDKRRSVGIPRVAATVPGAPSARSELGRLACLGGWRWSRQVPR